MKSFFLILIAVVTIFEVAGDILFKEWSIHNKNYLLIIGIFLYMCATTFWAFTLKYQDLSMAVVIFGVLTVVVGALVGVLLYHEQLSTLNYIGIVFGIICIILLEI